MSATFECMICLEDIPKTDKIIGPGLCDCNICTKCGLQYVFSTIQTSLPNCPSCSVPITDDYLQIIGAPSDIIYKYFTMRKRIQMSADPSWYWCPKPKCSGGGHCKVVDVLDNEWWVHLWEWTLVTLKLKSSQHALLFVCDKCNWSGCIRCRKQHAEGSLCKPHNDNGNLKMLLNQGRKIGGIFRPCYYCGVVTERNGGCSVIRCRVCNKKWDWNLGEELAFSFDCRPMMYEPLRKAHWFK